MAWTLEQKPAFYLLPGKLSLLDPVRPSPLSLSWEGRSPSSPSGHMHTRQREQMQQTQRCGILAIKARSGQRWRRKASAWAVRYRKVERLISRGERWGGKGKGKGSGGDRRGGQGRRGQGRGGRTGGNNAPHHSQYCGISLYTMQPMTWKMKSVDTKSKHFLARSTIQMSHRMVRGTLRKTAKTGDQALRVLMFE